MNDSANCGQCGHKCNVGQICQSGSCVTGSGNTYCDGESTNIITDVNNCMQCGLKCIDGEYCSSDGCRTQCGNFTPNLMNDSANCGQCGHKCDVGQICQSGSCVTGIGNTYCDGKFTVDIINNSANCGQCDLACPNGISCRTGGCITQCGNIQTSLMDDSANCGECGNKCNAGQICKFGSCTEGPGNIYCDGKYIIDIANDSTNCGVCGNKCNAGQICQTGSCVTGIGGTFCDGISVNTSTNSANCGQCGNLCVNSVCRQGSCMNVAPQVGDSIVFGHYEQDNATNGKEPIEWRVLAKDSGKILVISEKVLDVKQYNTTRIDITWEKSTIRSWLNGYESSYNTVGVNYTSDNFIDTAFTAKEKAKIVTSDVPAHANPNYSSTPAGNATKDKIFLLSVVEATNYFNDNASRQADATGYAIKKGVHVSGSYSNGICTDTHCYAFWWLRSPGGASYSAARVDRSGGVGLNGVNYVDIGVRPALWVNY